MEDQKDRIGSEHFKGDVQETSIFIGNCAIAPLSKAEQLEERIERLEDMIARQEAMIKGITRLLNCRLEVGSDSDIDEYLFE